MSLTHIPENFPINLVSSFVLPCLQEGPEMFQKYKWSPEYTNHSPWRKQQLLKMDCMAPYPVDILLFPNFCPAEVLSPDLQDFPSLEQISFFKKEKRNACIILNILWKVVIGFYLQLLNRGYQLINLYLHTIFYSIN